MAKHLALTSLHFRTLEFPLIFGTLNLFHPWAGATNRKNLRKNLAPSKPQIDIHGVHPHLSGMKYGLLKPTQWDKSGIAHLADTPIGLIKTTTSGIHFCRGLSWVKTFWGDT